MKKKILTIVTSIILIGAITPASAATPKGEKGYRYWGYFQAAPDNNSWTYAQTGPAATKLKDGAVEGWRFSFSSKTVDTGTPLEKPNFKSICGTEKAMSNEIRVALVIDFGLKEIAPLGEKVQPLIRKCVKIPASGNGLDALKMAVKVRTSASGMICGINNFPAKECSAEVATPKSLAKK